MKFFFAAILAASVALAPGAYAQFVPNPAPAETKRPTQKPAEPDESQLESHGHYKNKAGQEVHAPAKSKNGQAPAGASAQCRDGTYSFSKHHRGTCSHHGGVANWL